MDAVYSSKHKSGCGDFVRLRILQDEASSAKFDMKLDLQKKTKNKPKLL